MEMGREKMCGMPVMQDDKDCGLTTSAPGNWCPILQVVSLFVGRAVMGFAQFFQRLFIPLARFP